MDATRPREITRLWPRRPLHSNIISAAGLGDQSCLEQRSAEENRAKEEKYMPEWSDRCVHLARNENIYILYVY